MHTSNKKPVHIQTGTIDGRRALRVSCSWFSCEFVVYDNFEAEDPLRFYILDGGRLWNEENDSAYPKVVCSYDPLMKTPVFGIEGHGKAYGNIDVHYMLENYAEVARIVSSLNDAFMDEDIKEFLYG